MTEKHNEPPVAGTNGLAVNVGMLVKGLAAYAKAREKANRILAVCNNDENGLSDVLQVIENEGEIDPLVVMILALGEARVSGKIARANRTNARQKGGTWRRAAIEQYNSADWNQSQSLPDFCASIAEAVLTTTDGDKERAPKYRRVYDFMLAARKGGELKP